MLFTHSLDATILPKLMLEMICHVVLLLFRFCYPSEWKCVVFVILTCYLMPCYFLLDLKGWKGTDIKRFHSKSLILCWCCLTYTWSDLQRSSASTLFFGFLEKENVIETLMSAILFFRLDWKDKGWTSNIFIQTWKQKVSWFLTETKTKVLAELCCRSLNV